MKRDVCCKHRAKWRPRGRVEIAADSTAPLHTGQAEGGGGSGGIHGGVSDGGEGLVQRGRRMYTILTGRREGGVRLQPDNI